MGNEVLGDIAYTITQNDCIGYSQPERLTIYRLSGPNDHSRNVNVDCSEMICAIFEWAGVYAFTRDVWTGNLLYQARRDGRFSDWAWDWDYEPVDGDILLKDGHVCMIGRGGICEAAIAEDGSIDGWAGDSTGNEVHWTPYSPRGGSWYRVIRYTGNIEGVAPATPEIEDMDMSENTDLLREIRNSLRHGVAGQNPAGDLYNTLSIIAGAVVNTKNQVDYISKQIKFLGNQNAERLKAIQALQKTDGDAGSNDPWDHGIG